MNSKLQLDCNKLIIVINCCLWALTQIHSYFIDKQVDLPYNQSINQSSFCKALLCTKCPGAPYPNEYHTLSNSLDPFIEYFNVARLEVCGCQKYSHPRIIRNSKKYFLSHRRIIYNRTQCMPVIIAELKFAGSKKLGSQTLGTYCTTKMIMMTIEITIHKHSVGNNDRL